MYTETHVKHMLTAHISMPNTQDNTPVPIEDVFKAIALGAVEVTKTTPSYSTRLLKRIDKIFPKPAPAREHTPLFSHDVGTYWSRPQRQSASS